MDITKHIEENGLRRSEIIQKANISQSYLSMIETGRREIGIRNLQDFAAALGVTPQELRPDLAELLAGPKKESAA